MKNINRFKPFLYIILVLAVVAIAWALRWRAATTIPIDYDEDDYLRAGQQYAALMRSGDWAGFTQTNYRPEHPPLAKIIFGVSLLSTPEQTLLPDLSSSANPNRYIPVPLLRAGRTTSAFFGTLEVFLLALINPLAGLFLSIHTTTIKYTTEAMLEAVPAFTSLASVLCYVRAKKKNAQYKGLRGINAWMVGSALFLGLTAASKYIYCVVGIAILIDWFLVSRQSDDLKRFFLQAAVWGLLALAVFFVADPYLWPSPIDRLKSSVLFNAGYSTGTHVQEAGYPVWQSLVWLSRSVPWPGDQPAFVISLDTLIILLAILGLARAWQRERIYGIWLGVALLFLLIWPTKWPQYILILTAPLSLAASDGLVVLIVQPIQNWLVNRREKRGRKTAHHAKDLRRALPWLVPGILAFIVLTLIPLIFEFGVSMTHLNSASIRDGLHGGILRAVWAGLTGQIPVSSLVSGSNRVTYTGLSAYPYMMNRIANDGTLFFDVMWTVLSVFLQTGLGLGVALLLWQKGARFGKFWQALFILPWAIPEYVGALMWVNVFAPETGWLALAVKTYGTKIPFGFFSGWENSTSLWLLVILIPAIWYGFPFMMLAARVGLKTIPPDVFDAAAIDGANSWQTFQLVTWPLLVPLIVPAIIVRSIFAFNQFYLFRAFGAEDFGTLANQSFNLFNNAQYAISAVINIITVVLLIGFVVLFNRWSKASEGVNYA